MPGIEIPISGDLAGLQASIREMSAIFKQMAATVQAAMAPVQQVARQTAASMVQISTGATQAGTGMRGMVGAASSAGAAVANIAAGAKGLRSAFHFLRGLPAGWKSVAAAVAGAGAAVMGMVVAVRVVKSALSGLLGVARGVWNGIASGAAGAARSVKGVFSGVASAVPGGSLLGPLAGIAGIAGGVALVTSQLMGAFKAAAAFEDLEVRVSSFLGSTQAAAALLAELSTFADKTKFMTTDVQNAAGSLLGSGIRENISGIVQDIAAVSRDGEDLRSLADAVGKGFARGKFQTEALDAFMTRQINLMPALAKVTGLTGEALRDAIEEGLGFETVTAAIRALSQEGGQFFGVLERGGQTAAAKVSTLIGVWNTLRRTFAQPILDAIKPILSDAIGLVESFKTAAANAGKSVGQAVLAAFALVKSGQTMKLLGAGFDFAVAGAIDMLMRGLKAAGAFLSTVLPPIFEAAVAKLRDPMFWEGMAAVFRGIGGTIAIALQSAIADLEESLGKTKAARQRRELVAHDKERVEQDFFMGSQAKKFRECGHGKTLQAVTHRRRLSCGKTTDSARLDRFGRRPRCSSRPTANCACGSGEDAGRKRGTAARQGYHRGEQQRPACQSDRRGEKRHDAHQ